MGIYDRFIQAETVSNKKPHLYFHKGFWRVSAMPRKVRRSNGSKAHKRWIKANKYAMQANANTLGGR